MLLDSRVILCTLCTISNVRLVAFTRLVPVELVVVDEASQIEIGDYLPLLLRFQMTLRKLVFIGDDKQCSSLSFLVMIIIYSLTYHWFSVAPYGQDNISNLRSIFEMPHLRDRAIFLDTQCASFFLSCCRRVLYLWSLQHVDRMPVPIGNFISEEVYDGRLQTQHNITRLLSCRFADVKHGKEQRMGNSWIVSCQ